MNQFQEYYFQIKIVSKRHDLDGGRAPVWVGIVELSSVSRVGQAFFGTSLICVMTL